MAQNTVRLDDCEEEESEVTQEARARRRGGEEEKEETRLSEDRLIRRRWRKLGRGEGRKGKGMRPKGRV